MSDLTARLLGSKSHKRRRHWLPIFAEVCDRLVAAYGRPKLGNFRDPVREILYILLSAKTTEQLYQRAYKNLKTKFPALRLMADAAVEEIEDAIRGGGLARKRAAQVKAIAGRLLADLGKRPSRALRKLEPEQAFQYLVGLPGVGPKSALCVLTMSLDADVFAVDANVHRIARRMGALPNRLKHYEAQKRLPVLVPNGRSRDLHVGLVVHGRRVCLPRNPKCEACVLSNLCAYGKKRMAARQQTSKV